MSDEIENRKQIARQVVVVARQRLKSIWDKVSNDHDVSAAEERLRRWKSATVKALREQVSKSEADEFERAEIAFAFGDRLIAMREVIAAYGNRLKVLLEEIEDDPTILSPVSSATSPMEPVSSVNASTEMDTPVPRRASGVDVFISHSHTDVKLAEALVDLLKSALRLPSASIRCTSVEGHRLPGGASVEEQLRREVLESKVFIALVTEVSIRSTYVLFEMGARWGAQHYLVPVISSVDTGILKGPLSALNALSCSVSAQVLQLVDNVANKLGIQPEPPHAYQRHVEELLRRSEEASNSREEAQASRWTASRLGLTKLHVEILFWICLYSDYSTAEKIAGELRTEAATVRAATDILIEKGVASIDRTIEPPIYRVTAAGVSVVKSSLSVK
jgi:hypothetical protein